jgi:hypothetical protein
MIENELVLRGSTTTKVRGLDFTVAIENRQRRNAYIAWRTRNDQGMKCYKGS